MEITKIKLVNFRNYGKLDLSLNKNMNIFIGNNAQGKTNLLEAIMILGLTKSSRNTADSNLIKFGKNRSSLKCKVRDKKILRELSIQIEEGNKKLSVNNTLIKKISDYISNLNIISFMPDDLEIIKSSPSIRRNVLNIQLSQLSNKYLNTYNEYNKILKTRNEYLKILFTNSIADKKYLDIITDKLIEKAVIIYIMRKEYIDFINNKIDKIYEEITGDKDLFVQYIPNIEIENYDENTIRNSLGKMLKSHYKKELNYGVTMYGPHRDDFTFLLGEKDLKQYGSQGQQKLSIICYKLSEINIFESICGTKPVLLFDDIFSELDIKKRNRLLKYVESGIQSIITTTDLKNIQKKYLTDAYIFEVENGNVTKR